MRLTICVWLVTLGLSASLTGCFTEPEKGAPECYFDGELTLSVETPRSSEYCCTPPDGANRPGDAACQARFEADALAAAVLATCEPDNRGGGVCDIDCNAENCACLQRGDCGNGEVCQGLTGGDCARAGFSADRCTACVPSCTPPTANDRPGDAECQMIYEGQGLASAALATCEPFGDNGGACQLNCDEDNCNCNNTGDCASNETCQALSGADCESAGFQAGTARCTACVPN